MHMSHKAFMVFVVGVAGSGKSTVARQLAHELRAAYLDKDRLAGPWVAELLACHGEPRSARDGSIYYKEQLMPLEYSTLLDVAADITAAGISVVLDAPFGAYFQQRNYVVDQLQARGIQATPILVRVTASKNTTRQRLLSRGSDRDDWKLAHWDEFWTQQSFPDWAGVASLEYVNDAELHLDTLLTQLEIAARA